MNPLNGIVVVVLIASLLSFVSGVWSLVELARQGELTVAQGVFAIVGIVLFACMIPQIAGALRDCLRL